jgi:uncharacterized OB-fold protein
MQRDGVVYTETIVHAAPEQYAPDAPYQLAIIEMEDGKRITARVLGKTLEERVHIGDRVQFVRENAGVSYYRGNG